ncbi:L,D-transpeptidase [Leptolyngbya sp. FACHB-17]|uniref:L,D-transpeptidase n=1 Tax=unclassified Leptolyngbya TaxID=2650499 RepID=UPI00322089BC
MKGFIRSNLFRCSMCIIATAVFAAAPSQIVQAQSTGSNPTGSEATVRAMTTYKNTNQRWVEIRLSTQRLIAWEGKKQVHAVIVSTGKASTPTPQGVFRIQSKYRVARMQGDDYDIPDVPYTMYYSGGYGIHGAYWHNRFGTPVSHGCVNVAVDHAQWLFNWAKVGTPVVVR